MSNAEAEACAAAKAEGNAAYAKGDLQSAFDHYVTALEHWEAALQPVPSTHEIGARVRYSEHGFGVVMSAFTMFDEYFLKDLGNDQAIWAGEPGGELKRYSAPELTPVSQEQFDLRFAIAQNLAAVCLKLEKYKEAIDWANAALCMDGKAPKALMRLGLGLLRTGKPGPASDWLAAAQKAMPNDSEVRKLLREAEMKRSPTWVCANGCCGPWGIICGGPTVEAMAEAVKPRLKSEAAEDGADQGVEDDCSSCQDSDTDPLVKVKPRLKSEAAEDGADQGVEDDCSSCQDSDTDPLVKEAAAEEAPQPASKDQDSLAAKELPSDAMKQVPKDVEIKTQANFRLPCQQLVGATAVISIAGIAALYGYH